MSLTMLFYALMCVAALPWGAMACFDECTQKFIQEMGPFNDNRTANTSDMATSTNASQVTANFCRLMSSQVECLNRAMSTCPVERKALVQSMLNMFILPDYQRTCATTNTMPNDTQTLSSFGVVPMHYNNNGVVPTSGRTLLVCTQKVKACQAEFNQTFSYFVTNRNMTALCQSLKQYTLCFVDLLSSECSHLVPRHLVYNMQKQHGGMCSEDAQANTQTMIECTNKTIKCYTLFNSTFTPAAKDYNLKVMCSTIDEYTKCMQNVSTTNECVQFTAQSLASIAQLKTRHNAYCGDDNGQTALRCVESVQACYGTFNRTFFPALHASNLTRLCRSLNTFTSCVSRLSPTCSQQLGGLLRSIQVLKLQYRDKCHPSTLLLSTCTQVANCTNSFMGDFTSLPTSAGLCGSVGEYFQCVSKSLEVCKLPQSTTEVDFGALGTLMQDYCERISSNRKLLRCPAFVQCSTAITVSFSPTVKSMYEGSTWCTFMQLNIGCAEHALQSSGCFLEDDVTLKKYVTEVDRLRMTTCEKGVTDSGYLTRDLIGYRGAGSTCHRSLTAPLISIMMMAVAYSAL